MHPAATQTLVDSVVFAVDGQERLTLAASFCGDELSGYNKTLFVGEADRLTGADSFVGCLEAGDAHDGADYEIDVGMSGNADGAGGAVDDLDFGEPRGAELGTEGFGILLIGQG